MDNTNANANEDIVISDDDGNNNLANNKVSTNIDPDTVGNNVYVSLCSCTISVSCCMS
jgi:hypothetical protein